jgi:hypothetical protein
MPLAPLISLKDFIISCNLWLKIVENETFVKNINLSSTRSREPPLPVTLRTTISSPRSPSLPEGVSGLDNIEAANALDKKYQRLYWNDPPGLVAGKIFQCWKEIPCFDNGYRRSSEGFLGDTRFGSL